MAKEYGRPLSSPDLASKFLINVLEFESRDANKYKVRLSKADAALEAQKVEGTLSSVKYRDPAYKKDDKRDELRNKIFEELFRHQRLANDENIALGQGGAMPLTDVVSDKIAYILIGSPASGKSTIATKIADATGSYIVDSDYAKRKFPEFSSDIGASLVHEESALVTFGENEQDSDQVNLKEALTFFGINMVVAKVGSDVGRLRELRDDLIKEGYIVHLILVSLDRQESCRRAFYRFLRTDRYVNLGLIFDVYSNEPILTYYRCMNDPSWESVSKVCTLELKESGPKLKSTNLNDDSVLHQIIGGWDVNQG
ncbi:zeta toxin family protein [Shewanella sp. AS16]|uniref:zeta toxin family protein n=1 Tax=Shewanella sp. AS16 TaxID=2907625 RepID=UPI001F1CB8D4|nr:zeta toxin family protein [Shewanella sp. AS16]MCE9684891.1 zeta toxin family protein [Shewanella sp. AS16]